ncbi:unnamed protein product [Rotaria sordida]|uniref:Uncharacterized protein n=1 Tax=Rotaria sordida TaxID=392033 RepID=A0A814MPY7_9BILA|nr:unnamed protein product [Rotaria sordida]
MITGIIFILNSSNNDQSTDDAATSLILVRSDEERELGTCSSSLRNYLSNYTYRHVFLDIYFIAQIIFFIALHRSPVIGIPELPKHHDILLYGPFISLISCINLYMYAKYPSSLTSKLLTTSLLMNMGDISYAFYCLAEAIPIVASLISEEVEKSVLMRLWAGIVLPLTYDDSPLLDLLFNTTIKRKYEDKHSPVHEQINTTLNSEMF